ncbi:hypothetical protein [Nocardia gipuzkoensis]
MTARTILSSGDKARGEFERGTTVPKRVAIPTVVVEPYAVALYALAEETT